MDEHQNVPDDAAHRVHLVCCSDAAAIRDERHKIHEERRDRYPQQQVRGPQYRRVRPRCLPRGRLDDVRFGEIEFAEGVGPDTGHDCGEDERYEARDEAQDADASLVFLSYVNLIAIIERGEQTLSLSSSTETTL